MQRFDAWIEPALVSEWTRLIKFYASRRGERVDDGKIAVAMTWEVPTRDVRLAREQADQAFEKWPTVLRLERQAPFVESPMHQGLRTIACMMSLMPSATGEVEARPTGS
jgi:hypothetical protein